MKNLISFCFTLLTFSLLAQSPGFNYQAVLRNAEGQVMPNTDVTLFFSLKDGSDGTILYRESHAISSNEIGLLNTMVGTGTVENGNYEDIIGVENLDLQVELQMAGSTDIIDFGDNGVGGVPYALYGKDEDADPVNEMQSLAFSGDSLLISDMGGVSLKTIASPWSTEDGGLSYQLILTNPDNQRDNQLENEPKVEIRANENGGITRITTKSDGTQITEIVTTTAYNDLDDILKTGISFLLAKSDKIPDSVTMKIYESTETIIDGSPLKSTHTTKVGKQKIIIEQPIGKGKVNIKVFEGDNLKIEGEVILHEGRPLFHKVVCPKPSEENALFDSKEAFQNEGKVVWEKEEVVDNSGNTAQTVTLGERQQYLVGFDLKLNDEILPFISGSRFANLLEEVVNPSTECDGENVLFQRHSFSGQPGLTSGVAETEITNYCDEEMNGSHINLMGRYLAYMPNEEMQCIDFTKWTADAFTQGLSNGENNVYYYGADFANKSSFLSMNTLNGDFRTGFLATDQGGILGLASGENELGISMGFNSGTIPTLGMTYQTIPSHLMTVNNESAGFFGLNGANGSQNIQLSTITGSPDNGAITIHDNQGEAVGYFYVAANGQSMLQADVKNFIMKHPTEPDKNIVYASLEGPEAAAYNRGTAKLVEGVAEVFFEEHFRYVADPQSMTVMITPLSAESKGLAVVEKTKTGFKIVELHKGKGNYQFDWEVKCKRKGFEDYQVIREKLSVQNVAADPSELNQHMRNSN